MQTSKTLIIPNTMFLQNMYKYYIRPTDYDFIPLLGISDADWNGWVRGCLRDNLDNLLAETPSERNQRPVYRSTLSEGLQRLITITYFGLSLSESSSSSGFSPNLPSANACSHCLT